MLVNTNLSFGQPPIQYLQKLTTKDGLNSNTVFDIAIDATGYLWIATENGLNRYDGSEFVYYPAGNNPYSPSSNLVFKLLPLNDSIMLLGTNNGLNILNVKTGLFKKIYFAVKKPSDNRLLSQLINSVTDLNKDVNGNIWIGTATSLFRLDSTYKLQQSFWPEHTIRDLIKERPNFVYKILPVQSGSVMLFLRNGGYYWKETKNPKADTLVPLREAESGKFAFIKPASADNYFWVDKYLLYFKKGCDSIFLYDEQTNQKASCYFPDFDFDHINWKHSVSYLYDGWVALSFAMKGLALIRIQENNGRPSIQYYSHTYFPETNFRKVLSDKNKNLWLSSWTEGLSKIGYTDQLFDEIELPQKTRLGKYEVEIGTLLSTKYNFVFGTVGNGFYEWDRKRNAFFHHAVTVAGSETPDGNNLVWNFREGLKDTLWIGTQTGLYWYRFGSKRFGTISSPHPAALDNVAITTQFKDSHGLIWMGLGKGNGLCIFNPVINTYTNIRNETGGYPYRYPIAVTEDKASNMWFLSDNSCNLVKWTRSTGKFQVVELRLPAAGRKVGNGLFIDNNNVIWLAIESVGLITYNIETGQIRQVSKEKDFLTEFIQDIRSDKRGRIWFSTINGLFCFDPQKEQFIPYRTGENFTSGFFRDPVTDEFVAASFHKIVYFNPGKLDQGSSEMPVFITGIKIRGEKIAVPENRKISTKWNENDITVHFSGINLANGANNRYAYKLDNGSWTDIGLQKEMRFANLAPGHYQFEIRGAKNNGGWSPVTDHLEISIIPPFTSTAWFYLLCLSGIGFLFYAWYRYRLTQFLKLQKMRAEISRDLHDELGSKLTSISYLSLIARHNSRDNQLQQLLDKISQTSIKASASLREIVWGVNPDTDKAVLFIPRLVQYAAEMLELRNIDLIAQTGDFPEDLKLNLRKRRDFEMIFKEAIHNIVKHSAAKQVCLQLSFSSSTIHLHLKDDGEGFNTRGKNTGNGLMNMSKRAKTNHWQFSLTSEVGSGTSITLQAKIT